MTESPRPPWFDLQRRFPCAVALGVFDGVHQGHREILQKTCESAKRLGLTPVVFSFRNHPKTVLGNGTEPAPRLLVTPERRIELIHEQGIAEVLSPPFSWEWAKTPARKFAEEFLVETLQARHVTVGFNYCFGNRAEGRVADLERFGREFGFEVEVVSACEVGSEEVSSTRIRTAIVAGDLDEARRLLGRPHEFSGTVVRGEGRGKHLGFPTANLEPDLPPLLPLGVYAVRAHQDGARDTLPGMFFLGPRKTFGDPDHAKSAEVHLIGYQGDLYGHRLRLDVYQKIRDGRKFSGPEELSRQLQRDREACNEYFSQAT